MSLFNMFGMLLLPRACIRAIRPLSYPFWEARTLSQTSHFISCCRASRRQLYHAPVVGCETSDLADNLLHELVCDLKGDCIIGCSVGDCNVSDAVPNCVVADSIGGCVQRRRIWSGRQRRRSESRRRVGGGGGGEGDDVCRSRRRRRRS